MLLSVHQLRCQLLTEADADVLIEQETARRDHVRQACPGLELTHLRVCTSSGDLAVGPRPCPSRCEVPACITEASPDLHTKTDTSCPRLKV